MFSLTHLYYIVVISFINGLFSINIIHHYHHLINTAYLEKCDTRDLVTICRILYSKICFRNLKRTIDRTYQNVFDCQTPNSLQISYI